MLKNFSSFLYKKFNFQKTKYNYLNLASIGKKFPLRIQTKKLFSEFILQTDQLDKEDTLLKEIGYCQSVFDLKNSNKKLRELINYSMSKLKDKDDFMSIYGYVNQLCDNLRDLHKIEESIETLNNFFNGIDKLKSDEFDAIKISINDKIAFDYTLLEDHETSLKYLKKNLYLIEEKIKKDEISVVDDKVAYSNCLWNITTMKIYLAVSKEEVFEDLLKILAIYKEYPAKLVNLEINLFKQLGVISYHLDNYEDSLKYSTQALQFKKMIAQETDEDSSIIYKYIAHCYFECDNFIAANENYKKAAEIKQNIILELDKIEYLELGKEHFIELGKIYEALGDNDMAQGKTDFAVKYYQKAIEKYLEFAIEPIFLANCYFIVSEIYLKQDDYVKVKEYSKRYISAFNKFIQDHEKELNDPDFDMDYYSRMDLPSHYLYCFKAYRNLAKCNILEDEKDDARKNIKLATEMLKNIENRKIDGNGDEFDLGSFIILKYELAGLNELNHNYSQSVVDFDTLLEKLEEYKEDKIFITGNPEDPKDYIDKNNLIVDILYSKANAYMKLENHEKAKILYVKIQEFIHKNNLDIDKKILEEIDKKISIIRFKQKSHKK